MKYNWVLFWTAMMFLTRIPVPKIEYSNEILTNSTRYFPVVGVLLGFINYFIYLASVQFFPKEIAILLSMSFSFLLTGGFHEDGLADSCDAFGGGYTKEKILEIMKDSRIGSFGTLGLFSVLFLKFYSLLKIPEIYLFACFILGQGLSRIFPIWIMKFLPYVQLEGKSKPIAETPSNLNFGITNVFGLIIFLPFLYLSKAYILVFFSLVLFLPIVIFFLNKKIQGYTGDTLGAAQQLSEILIYLSIYLCGFI